MERLIKGDVVVVPFPFSDLKNSKRRPALVASVLKGDDEYAITLNNGDFETGTLQQASNIRPNRIFTADQNIILYQIGHLKNGKFAEAIKMIL